MRRHVAFIYCPASVFGKRVLQLPVRFQAKQNCRKEFLLLCNPISTEYTLSRISLKHNGGRCRILSLNWRMGIQASNRTGCTCIKHTPEIYRDILSGQPDPLCCSGSSTPYRYSDSIFGLLHISAIAARISFYVGISIIPTTIKVNIRLAYHRYGIFMEVSTFTANCITAASTKEPTRVSPTIIGKYCSRAITGTSSQKRLYKKLSVI